MLLGSTVRVVTDAIDAGRFLPITPIHDLILKSHIYDYGFLTVSPGIYLVVAAILLVSLAILKKIEPHGATAVCWLGIVDSAPFAYFTFYWEHRFRSRGFDSGNYSRDNHIAALQKQYLRAYGRSTGT